MSKNLLHLDPFAAAIARQEREERERLDAGSQADDSSRTAKSSQPPEGQPPKPPNASHESQPQHDQPADGRLNMLAALPDVKGHLETPHQLTDHLFRHLDTFEQAVYLQLYRLSWGHKKNRCRISNDRLAERANMSVSKIKTTTRSLEVKGLIEKIATPHGVNVIQGVEYEVYAPTWQLRRSQPRQDQLSESQPLRAPNKKELLKETEKADCPDCFGTGFHYPEGTNNGVKRCKHERLNKGREA